MAISSTQGKSRSRPVPGGPESSAGDDFHLIWGARKALELLNLDGDLKALDHRFLFIISIDQVCVTDDDLIHFVFPLEDHRHLINLGDVLKDPLLQFRFRIDPDVA